MVLDLNPGTGGEKVDTKLNASGEHVQTVRTYHDPDHPLIISQFLDLNGDGSGVSSFIGDYSTINDIAYMQPAPGEIFHITRMIICYQDAAGMRASRYATLAAPLTNGIELRIQDDTGTIVNLTNGSPVVHNAGWGGFCFDADVKSWGSGDEIFLARWTFEKSGTDIRLDGDENERLELLLKDDFSGIVSHQFLVQGYKEV